jgi:hypothetical protein
VLGPEELVERRPCFGHHRLGTGDPCRTFHHQAWTVEGVGSLQGASSRFPQHPDEHRPECPILRNRSGARFYTTGSPCGERDAAEEIEAVVMLLEMVED